MKPGVYWDWNPLDYKKTVDSLVYELTKKRATEIFNLCVALSPIDTGAYRASWSVSENAPLNNYVGRQRRGSVLPPPSMPKISSLFYRKLYISNGSPYASLIEAGYSPQAPNGVMRVAIKLSGAI